MMMMMIMSTTFFGLNPRSIAKKFNQSGVLGTKKFHVQFATMFIDLLLIFYIK